MYLEKLLSGYKLVRFFFAFSFFFSFVIYGKVLEKNDYNIPEIILFIYLITSFTLLFFRQILFLEFFLDIVFLTAFIIFFLKLTSYLSILYLYPIFFYGVLTGSRKVYILSTISFFIMLFLKAFIENIEFSTLFLIAFLNGFSFFVIAFAGIKLYERLKKQEIFQKQIEKLEKEQEIYKKLYQISANIAHEIKNPLASISASAQLLKEGNFNEKLVNIIYEESKRIDALIKDFLNLSKSFSKTNEKINIYEEINKVIKSCILTENIDVKVFTKDSKIYINMNKQAFNSLIRNIIKNAIEWAKSQVIVSVEKIGNYIYINVEDDGEGVEDEIKEEIFEPFFSKNPQGTGLGLSIARNVALNYQGDIIVSKSEILGGAKFTVILPLEEKNESTNS